MKSYSRVIGIDVCTERLDVSDSGKRIAKEVRYTKTAVAKSIVKSISAPTETLVICEGTGGVEVMLVDMLHDAGVDVVVANPAQVRNFAKGHGFLEKSDKIDAYVLQLFGQQVKVCPTTPRTQEERHFMALGRRRSQVVKMISQESNRLRQCTDSQTKEFIMDSLKMLKKQEKMLSAELKKLLDARRKVDPKIAVIESVPGIGLVTTVTLVAELPELGKISRGSVAKLVGVSPFINQTGKKDGKRHAKGGRRNIRKVLYMAALVAIQCNPVIQAFYEKLIAQKKKPKVAIMACMRKLLTIVNDMVRRNELWRSTKKSVAGEAVAS